MSKWIEFVGGDLIPGGKTKIWEVRAINASALGEVKWYGPWRCYSYFPRPGTLYERQCLRDIAAFCETETTAHYQKARAEKAAKKTPKPETPFYGPFSSAILAKMKRPLIVMAHTSVQLEIFLRENQIPKKEARRIMNSEDIRAFNPSQPMLLLAGWEETRDSGEIMRVWNARGGTVIEVPEERHAAAT